MKNQELNEHIEVLFASVYDLIYRINEQLALYGLSLKAERPYFYSDEINWEIGLIVKGFGFIGNMSMFDDNTVAIFGNRSRIRFGADWPTERIVERIIPLFSPKEIVKAKLSLKT